LSESRSIDRAPDPLEQRVCLRKNAQQ